MNQLHALLARQVKRQFGSLENLSAECRAFVHDVDAAYRELEADRGMLERALEISSEEQMQANAQMRALLEAFPDIYFRLDGQGRILEYKAGVAADTSSPPHRLVGKLIQAVPRPEAARKFQAAIERVGQSQSLVAIEYSLKVREAEEYYEARLLPLPQREIFVIVRNITERKRSELALQSSEFFLRKSQAVATIGSYYLNAQTGRWRSSAALDEILGIHEGFPKDVNGWISVVHPEHQEEMLRYLQEHVIAGHNRFDWEYRIIRKSDRQERWVHGLGELEFDDQGNTITMIGTIQDITARRLSEAAQNNLKERLAATLNALPDLLFATDPEGRILDFRAPSTDKLYLAPDNFLGRTVKEVLPPEAAAIIMGAIAEAFNNGVSSGATYSLPKGDGCEWFEMTGARQGQPGARDGRVVVLARDITKRKEAEDRLRQSEERLQEAVQVSSIGTFEHDHLTDTIYWSAEQRKNYGWSSDEPVNLAKFLDCVYPEDREHIAQAIRRAHDPAGNGRYDVEHRIIRCDGCVRWLVTRSQTFFEGEGAARRLVRTSGAVLDITEQKLVEEKLAQARDQLEAKVQERTRQLQQANDSLRESEDRARSILNNVQAGIVVVDPVSHEVIEANPVALSLLKRSREEVIGRLCHSHICPADRGQCPVTDLGGTVDNSERVLVRGDGTSIPILKTVVPITLGGRPVLLESFVDISERKRAQTELEQAKLAAEVASEAKSRFLAMMSHEIRTPLNGVTGVLHLLQKDHLTAQQKRWLDMASTSASTLLLVINDILDFSKVEAGKLDLHPAPTDLRSVVENTAASFAERARARGLAWNTFIDPNVPSMVAADGGRLAQVLGNLLGNAVKFTDAGSVALRVTLQSEANNIATLRFEVADTGEGVAPEQQERLFKPFSQVDSSSTRRHGGTGLGLGICKHLVELMAGVIGVETAAGKGSTFWFELPLKIINSTPEPPMTVQTTVARKDSTAVAAPFARLTKSRVLLAEDNEINQELAREMIQFAGCECDCVVNGPAAVQAAISGNYDLMFMDCMMPGMDGYNATRAIRAEEAKLVAAGQPVSRLPIIALTANAMEGDREECLAAGMDDYLSKPLDPEKVVQAINHWLTPQDQDMATTR